MHKRMLHQWIVIVLAGGLIATLVPAQAPATHGSRRRAEQPLGPASHESSASSTTHLTSTRARASGSDPNRTARGKRYIRNPLIGGRRCRHELDEGRLPPARGGPVSQWTRVTVLWVLVALVLLMALTFPFTFFFDVHLTPFGFMYSYFWAFPQAAIVYAVGFRLRAPWTSTVLMGVQGILGAPVDYYFDWVVQRNLIEGWYAALYIPLFLAVGLIADLSLAYLRPDRFPVRASLLSAFLFTGATLGAWILASVLLYPWNGSFDGTWLQYGYFLIPYALATGALGGYVGYGFARDFDSFVAEAPFMPAAPAAEKKEEKKKEEKKEEEKVSEEEAAAGLGALFGL